jgi:DNA-directed RNA polymerase specialized sigma subunit
MKTTVKRVVKKPKSKKETHYVNNKDLFAAMQKHWDLVQTGVDPRASDYIGLAILTICQNLAKKSNFVGYTWKEDMVSEGIKDCVKAINGFNPNKYNNPFGYFL